MTLSEHTDSSNWASVLCSVSTSERPPMQLSTLGATLLTHHTLALEGAPPGRAALCPPDIFHTPRATRSSRSCDKPMMKVDADLEATCTSP